MKSMRRLPTALIAGACVIALGSMAEPASARSRPPAPTTTTTAAPTVVPTPTAAKVVIVKAGTQPYLYEDVGLIQVSPFTRSGEGQWISGIGVAPGQTFTVLYGNINFSFGVPQTDYTFRYRNQILDTATNTYRYSPWVEFTVQAPRL